MMMSRTIASAIYGATVSAAGPAMMSASRISSDAYATDESASDEKTASAFVFVRRSCSSACVAIGAPIIQRRTLVTIASPHFQRATRLHELHGSQ